MSRSDIESDHGHLMRFLKILALLLATLPGIAYSGTGSRWYKPQHTAIGERLYREHCEICHGSNAVGAPDWHRKYDNGLVRPPPLNGTAHSWHHPLSVLYRQIMTGSAPGVGNMPPFKKTLTRGEALAIIAYFQSLWPDRIYQAWNRINESDRPE